jgi:hypothetical protein
MVQLSQAGGAAPSCEAYVSSASHKHLRHARSCNSPDDAWPRQEDFELLKQLGTGYTSMVYAARVKGAALLAPGMDDLVVLKVIPKRRAVEMQTERLTVQERASLEHLQGSPFILYLVRARGLPTSVTCVLRQPVPRHSSSMPFWRGRKAGATESRANLLLKGKPKGSPWVSLRSISPGS